MSDGSHDSRKLVFSRGLTWARDEGLHTDVRPDDAVLNSAGIAVIDGFRLKTSRWSDVGYVAFLLSVAAALLWFAGERPGSTLGVLGTIAGVASAVAGVTAALLRRAAKVPLVLIVAATPAAVRVPMLVELLAQPAGSGEAPQTWIISAKGFTSKALTHIAGQPHVQCFVPRGDKFVPALASIPTNPQEASPAVAA